MENKNLEDKSGNFNEFREKIFRKYQHYLLDGLRKVPKGEKIATIGEGGERVGVLLEGVEVPRNKYTRTKSTITLKFQSDKNSFSIDLIANFLSKGKSFWGKVSSEDGLRNASRSFLEVDSEIDFLPIKWNFKKKADLDSYKKDALKIEDGEAGRVVFEGALKGLSIKYDEGDFLILNETVLGVKNISLDPDQAAPDEELKEPAERHALEWIARCVERVLYIAYFKEEVKIKGDNMEPLSKMLGLTDIVKKEDDERAFDISPWEMQESMQAKGFYFPWSVYQAACATLNLGRNLILVGPPGCGKTELALALGDKISAEGVGAKMVTASPAWTSGDLIGRYFPDPETGQRLIFQPGVFLDALDEDQCLIIDEMNRANIDECFGELFTLLSGKSVDLPYKERDDDDEDQSERLSELKTIRINSAGDKRSASRTNYPVGKRFRIIGTMNDFDRSSLHQMSFALLRRFNVIRIDPPEPKDLEEMLQRKFNHIQGGVRLFGVKMTKYYVSAYGNLAVELVRKIFICHKNESGLIGKNVTGVASMLDILKFIVEGMRHRNDGKSQIDKGGEYLKSWVASLAMHAFMIYAAPQLESRDGKGIEEIKKYISDIFEDYDYYAFLSKDQSSIEIEHGVSLSEKFNQEFSRLFGSQGW